MSEALEAACDREQDAVCYGETFNWRSWRLAGALLTDDVALTFACAQRQQRSNHNVNGGNVANVNRFIKREGGYLWRGRYCD